MSITLTELREQIRNIEGGAPGPPGPPGPTGPTGPTGPAGATGDAEEWHSGSGAPSGALGTLGDWYLRTDNGDVYENADPAWVVRANITGPAGATGATGPQGEQGIPGTGITEVAYTEFTANVVNTVTSAATALTVVSAGAITYTAAVHLIEFFSPFVQPAANQSLTLCLFDGSTHLGRIGQFTSPATIIRASSHAQIRLTPSAGSHTYSVRVFGSASGGSVGGGAGGADPNFSPGFIRITKI